MITDYWGEQVLNVVEIDDDHLRLSIHTARGIYQFDVDHTGAIALADWLIEVAHGVPQTHHEPGGGERE